MSSSMDDLLRKNEQAAQAVAASKRREQEQDAKHRAIEKKGHEAFQQILERVRVQVEQFNSRSSSGEIQPLHGGKDLQAEFLLPNTGRRIMLSGVIDFEPKSIKGKLCGNMVTLSESSGRGVHFLRLEDEQAPERNEWVAVRVRNSGAVAPDRRASKVEPFTTSLNEIIRGTNAMHVIEPEYSSDLDGAILEIMGYGFA